MFNITKDNILDYAIRHYTIPAVLRDDLLVDMQRISLINQSLKRFEAGKSPRVLLNQLITLFNTFEAEAVCSMLLFKTDEDMHPRLKACLLTLGVWREEMGKTNFEPDVELLLALNNDLDMWRKPCQRSL